MGLEDIKEIKECHSQEEVNQLLNQPDWRLIDLKIEKVRVPVGKEKVGIDASTSFMYAVSADRFEIKYEERLASLYVVGRF